MIHLQHQLTSSVLVLFSVQIMLYLFVTEDLRTVQLQLRLCPPGAVCAQATASEAVPGAAGEVPADCAWPQRRRRSA
jgi:hypothetical protein